MIEHVVTIKMIEELDSFGIEVTTPEGLGSLQVVGLLEMAKKQYIESKHDQGPTIHQSPDDEA